MPKLKTVKSAQKRIIKITANGKLMRLTMSSQHLARKKSKRARKNALMNTTINKVNVKKMKRLVPYL